ncbi:TetR/AcrR family transcriptional regulator [Alicyclobacillus fastidiosus]|uniref:TetR/AcrR family transcriptional regulator n=1 Tax=Alicyclobacillus fastidiosus TaxID=392011 RepID=A0ABY6ZHL4_9BACL|nr:TetR/AcrR family transcriptional regulator [Alicyclobacillus fastidiosus]WAH42235.1 TetR/AcrR family transcriptional regulator [Alicyclobacillus fastidiosus]GMA64032.1 TetR family transcriptional regulator [Alicyclobacillus fastidiosus]
MSSNKQNEIALAAVKLFEQKGYRATSVQDIADAVGLQKGSLYHYIASKEDLLMQIAHQAILQFNEQLQSILAQDISARQKLELMIRTHLTMSIDNLETTTVLWREAFALGEGPQEVIARMSDEYLNLVTQILREGVQSGEFHVTEPRVTALAILGACNWVYRWYQQSGSLSAEDISDIFGRLFLDGLLT